MPGLVELPKVRRGVVAALMRRDLRMYFSNPSGYVFLTLFILLSAAAAFWQDRFFLNNLANLDQLNGLFPYILLFFVPALTMSVWAEERKLGTDELLFTLPATDLEIVLGKYAAVLGVYGAALALSLSHALVLVFLGSPDWGLLFANYLGYALLGAALAAAGMAASLLTSIPTIAFILGAAGSALVVLPGVWAERFSPALARFLEPVSAAGHFAEFGRGAMPLTSVLYFLALAGFFLYLNVLLVGRRHWPPAADGYRMSTHHAVRAVAVALALLSSVVLVSRLGLRLDATAEGLHSLSAETRELLRSLPDDRPVFVQAYLSPEAPEPLVQTRATLESVLREMESVSGGRVQVRIQDTAPFTEAAREAREMFGITPRQIPSVSSARTGLSEVFLGVAFTCAAEEQVIPFFDRGLPVEYELARSIRVVANTEKRRVGVISKELRLFGGLDFQTMQSAPEWSVVDELRKQYEVVQVQPNSRIEEELDGLLVVLPSTLADDEMDNVMDAVRAGVPALLLVDPLPIVNMGLAPSEPPGASQNPFMQQGQPPPTPKGDVASFLAGLGFSWDPGSVVWDAYNPHPDLGHLPPEVVFLGEGNGNPEVFSGLSPASAGLQQVVLIYPGHFDPLAGSASAEFTPLLTTGDLSGRFPYFQLVQRNFLGSQLNRNLPHRPDALSYVVAAEARTYRPAEQDTGDSESEDAEDAGENGNEADSTRVIAIADLDFISEQFFELRRIGPPNLNFDNVSFFLNAMDVLVGDESFVALRNRRVRHRTLERVEAQVLEFTEQRAAEEDAAERRAEEALRAAQDRLDSRVAAVEERDDLDSQAKQIMARNLQEVENRRFSVLEANINAEKDAEVRASEERMERQVRRIQGGIRTLAVLLPPIPVFLLGVYTFVRRRRAEREGAAAARRLRQPAGTAPQTDGEGSDRT